MISTSHRAGSDIPSSERKYRAFFGDRAEIKISLGITDYDEAFLRCQEENLRLERAWRSNIVGRPPNKLIQEQISALAGIVFDEEVAAQRANPDRPIERENAMLQLQARQRRDWHIMPMDQTSPGEVRG